MNASAVVVDINDAFSISNGKQPHPAKDGPRKRMSQQEAAALSRDQIQKKSSIVKKGSTKSRGSGSSDDNEGKVIGMSSLLLVHIGHRSFINNPSLT